MVTMHLQSTLSILILAADSRRQMGLKVLLSSIADRVDVQALPLCLEDSRKSPGEAPSNGLPALDTHLINPETMAWLELHPQGLIVVEDGACCETELAFVRLVKSRFPDCACIWIAGSYRQLETARRAGADAGLISGFTADEFSAVTYKLKSGLFKPAREEFPQQTDRSQEA